jgi:hypothetical protein
MLASRSKLRLQGPAVSAGCGRVDTESAHGVRRAGGIVASEGGGQQVPTQGGGMCADAGSRDAAAVEVSR